MRYDLYGNPVQEQRTPESVQGNITMYRLQAAQNKARSLVAQYNRNPKKLDDEEASEAKAMAEAFGYGTTTGESRDKAGFGDAAIGMIGGAVDSALLGILKNEWYTNRRNGDYAIAGRIAGLVASVAAGGFMNPSAIGKVGGAITKVFGAGKGAKIIKGAIQYGTTAGVTRGIKGGVTSAIAAGGGTGTGIGAIKAMLQKKMGAEGYASLAKGLGSAGKYAPYAALGAGGLRTLGNIGQSVSDVRYGTLSEEDLLNQANQLPSMQQMPQR